VVPRQSALRPASLPPPLGAGRGASLGPRSDHGPGSVLEGLARLPACDLAEQIRVRAQADELQRLGVGLAVDEEEIAADVALAAVTPRSGERLIAVGRWEGVIRGERSQHGPQEGIEAAAVRAFRLALEVPPEGGGGLNASMALAHSDLP